MCRARCRQSHQQVSSRKAGGTVESGSSQPRSSSHSRTAAPEGRLTLSQSWGLDPFTGQHSTLLYPREALMQGPGVGIMAALDGEDPIPKPDGPQALISQFLEVWGPLEQQT